MPARILAAVIVTLVFSTVEGAAQTPNAQLGSQIQPKKVDPAKEQAIRKLFEVTRMTKTLIDGLKFGLESQKKSQPNVPAVFWDEFIKRAETDAGAFLTTLVEIYDEHYTKEQIEEMLAFYETPLGRMMAEKSSAVGVATMAAAERWGMKLGMQVMMELVEKGAITP
jgi:hypothetical protein